jgi:hypothetical protein
MEKRPQLFRNTNILLDVLMQILQFDITFVRLSNEQDTKRNVRMYIFIDNNTLWNA